MLHNCAVGFNAYKATPDSPCKRWYDKYICTDCTTFNEYGCPVYKRPTARDLNVVPHNRSMLLDWRGHVNAEYASSVKSCLYLYSYLFKGTKKDYVIAANNSDENENETEEEIYLNGRFLCSMDAMNRALGYHTYPQQQPSAVSIAVKSQE